MTIIPKVAIFDPLLDRLNAHQLFNDQFLHF